MIPEHEKPVETYNKKKIVIVLLIIALVFAGFIFLKQKYSPTARKVIGPGVQGAQIVNPQGKASFNLPNVNDLQNKVDEIKNQVSNINVADIASSSPQVQDIIKQINNLPSLPGNVAKNVCEQLCKKL